jgi:hypothetical protein
MKYSCSSVQQFGFCLFEIVLISNTRFGSVFYLISIVLVILSIIWLKKSQFGLETTEMVHQISIKVGSRQFDKGSVQFF